jgi:uncharacterized protein YggT (Ycf19 family)
VVWNDAIRAGRRYEKSGVKAEHNWGIQNAESMTAAPALQLVRARALAPTAVIEASCLAFEIMLSLVARFLLPQTAGFFRAD